MPHIPFIGHLIPGVGTYRLRGKSIQRKMFANVWWIVKTFETESKAKQVYNILAAAFGEHL